MVMSAVVSRAVQTMKEPSFPGHLGFGEGVGLKAFGGLGLQGFRVADFCRVFGSARRGQDST